VKKIPLIARVKTVSLKSYWLTVGEMRLDASFYAQDVISAKRFLNEIGYTISPLEAFLENVFYPPRSKRYLTDESHGVPYLTASELSYFQPKPKFIVASKIPRIESWYVKAGMILLSRSGTVGITTLATKQLEKYVFSEHLIRLIPKSDTLIGFIYAFLNTWIGKALITKDQFGGVVDEIEPHHVKALPIPKLPDEVQKAIHDNILKVSEIRDEARVLLQKAQQCLNEELGISETEQYEKIKTFHIRISDMQSRFDASFHDKAVERLRDDLRRGKYPIEKIGDNLGTVFIPPRFKRIYVGKEFGVPFLSGSNIAEVKPYNLKYLSRKASKHLEKWTIHDSWVLVTCSGTIGRVAISPKGWDGWSVSQHVLRIIPNTKKIHSGFLTAFLMNKYGHDQVLAKTYGGVIDELSEEDVKDVLVPMPPIDTQERIGELVLRAFELKELANRIEDETVSILEDMLTSHKKLEMPEQNLKEVSAYVESFELIANEEFQESRNQLEHGETMSLDEFKKEHGF
jgi:type I restriction enzyme S subunit